MKRVHFFIRLLLGYWCITTIMVAPLMVSSVAHAACSKYAGKVVFNEVYQGNGGPFVEIKVVDPSVVSATSNFQNWKIDLYAGNNSTKQATDVSSGFTNIATNSCGQTSLWIKFPSSVLSFLAGNNPPFNFVLYDSSGGGKIVDILRLGDNVSSFYGSGSAYTTCPLIENQLPTSGSADTYYDAQKGSGNSVKDWYRNPDGTGPWGGQGTSSPGNTSCSTDTGSGAGTFGLAKTTTATVVSTNTNFSYSLYAINGATAVSSPASVVITDNLTAVGLTFVSCTTAQGTCTNSGGTVTWTVGAVAANTRYTATLTVKAANAGTITNQITSNVGSGPSVSAYAPPVQVMTVLDYRMEDSSWANNASITDSGGGSATGTMVLSSGSASSTTGEVCMAPTLNLGIGEGVSVANHPTLNIASGGTISFWINPTANAGRYLFSKGTDYFAYLNSSGKLVFGWGNNGSGAGLRTRVTSTSSVPTGSWTYVALVFDSAASKAYIYINGNLDATATSVPAPTIGSTAMLIGSLDSVSWNAYENTAGRTGFAGKVDEFKVFNATLTADSIWGIDNNEAAGLNYDGTTRVCGGTLHHLEIADSTSGSGLTCTPSTLTVRACSDAACSSLYTSGVTGTLTASAGTANWGSGSATFSIASGSSSTTKTLQLTTPTTATLGISSPSPSTTSTTTCTFPSPSNNCAYTAADAGFLFDVPNHASNVAQTVSVSGVKKSNNSLACTPAFASVSKNVAFKCSYTNPTTGTLPVLVGGTALNSAGSSSSACDASGKAISLAFNASGVANTTFQYADVGNIGLTATYAGSGSDAGLNMTGSDGFIAAPNDFAFGAITAAPIMAGSSFSATVTARNASGVATPNFGKETAAESVTLSRGSRVAPSGANDCTNGPCDGAVSGSVTLPWSNGVATTSNASYSDVGTMTLNATLASGSYLSSGLTASGTSATVGPFVPAYFNTTVTQGCGSSFTYSGQPFKVTVTAKNAAGNTTVNYSNLSGCAVCSKSVTLQDPTATANFNGTNTIAASAFDNVVNGGLGGGIGSSNVVAYTWPAVTTAPAAIILRAIDSSVTPNVSSSGHTEGTTTVRSGKLQLTSYTGSATSSLQIPVQAFYWSGNSWVKNSNDSCTNIPLTSVALYDYLDSKGATTTSWTTSVSSNITLSGGLGYITLTAPSPSGSTGSVSLATNLGTGTQDTSCLSGTHPTMTAPTTSLAYLRGKNGNCTYSNTYTADPSAVATFGVYTPESTKTMYIRELY